MSQKQKLFNRLDKTGKVTKRWAESQGIPWPSVRRTMQSRNARNVPGQAYVLAA